MRNNKNKSVAESIRNSVNNLPICVVEAMLECALDSKSTPMNGVEISEYSTFSELLGFDRSLIVGFNKVNTQCLRQLGAISLSVMAYNTMNMNLMPKGEGVEDIYSKKYMWVCNKAKLIMGSDSICDVLNEEHAREFLIWLLNDK